VIELKGVSFRYKNGSQDAGLSHINLAIGEGECVLLCGESGCGKTTLTRLFNGLIPHYFEGVLSGKVLINGGEAALMPLYETAALVGSVFQNPQSQFFNVETTSEITFGCENLGLPEDEIVARLEKVSDEMKIKHLLGRSIFSLSGGEKQKIACASVAALYPSVFALDEPSSNLDRETIAELRNLIGSWKTQGKTIIIAEHRLHYLRGLADRIVYMREGKVLCEYSWNKLEALPVEKFAALGLRSLDLQGLKAGVGNLDQPAPDRGWIGLSNFHFSYKRGPRVLDIPSLMLPKGGIIAVIGRNGAGKSTFARCLCGLEKRCPGSMETGGKTYKARARLKHCYMVMQEVNHQLFTESVLDEVLISMKKPDMAEAEKILESLDLLSFKTLHPMSLSGGQKQRVAIASALASRRELIVFDEPTSGLDRRHMGYVAENMRSLQRQGKTLLVITHDPELILTCCTYTLYMENGKITGAYPLDDEGTRRTLDYFTGERRYIDDHT
jgi:energy-coupling factor transport system ATP-binding protein